MQRLEGWFGRAASRLTAGIGGKARLVFGVGPRGLPSISVASGEAVFTSTAREPHEFVEELIRLLLRETAATLGIAEEKLRKELYVPRVTWAVEDDPSYAKWSNQPETDKYAKLDPRVAAYYRELDDPTPKPEDVSFVHPALQRANEASRQG